MLFVLMGVSGSGKTTVGRAVADRLGLPFFEGDDFHPVENIERMRAGIALSDDDRVSWVKALARAINRSAAKDAIVACSALTIRVREQLSAEVAQPIRFLHLLGERDVIRERLAQRSGHFMSPGLLDSQFAALQPFDAAIPIDIARPLVQVIAEVEALIAAQRDSDA